MAGNLAHAVLALARMGYAVFPCIPGGKRPAVRGGFKAATRDPGTIQAWWTRWSTANLAVATFGVVVVDIDTAGQGWPPDPEQRAAIRETQCPLARTPRGGFHLYFRLPLGKRWRCSAGQLARGVDVRTTGGYVVVPPSRTDAGQYKWLRPLVPPGRLPLPPQWLAAALDQLALPARHSPPNGYRAHLADAPATLREGQRNCGLASLAGRLRRAGASQAELEAALLAFNSTRCQPPLPEREVLAIARSIARYPAADALPPVFRRAWAKAIRRHRSKRRTTTHGW